MLKIIFVSNKSSVTIHLFITDMNYMTIFDLEKLNRISLLLQERKQTIACAESCTAGLIQNTLSRAIDATSFFQGGMTLYNDGQKAKHLHVNPIFAASCNSVDRKIAEKMALEIVPVFNAELGLSITGYAQPIPHRSIDDCYAYLAIAEGTEIILSKKIEGDPLQDLFENQSIFSKKALDELLGILEKQEGHPL